jgi:hypothetical protein
MAIILPYWLSDAELYVARNKFAHVLSKATACSVLGNLLTESLFQFDMRDKSVAILTFLNHHAVRSSYSFLLQSSVGGQFNNNKEP